MTAFTSFFENLVNSTSPNPTGLEMLFAVLLSLVLNLAVGALYKLSYRGTRYSQDYVHTLVIIGTVVTVIIMVVKGNSSIAFGMFAAFSIIRFRRNLSQARDLGFIFLSMATGMVVGARLYLEAGIAVALVGGAIYLMAKLDLFAPSRVSHSLRVRVTNDIEYDEVFSAIFSQFVEESEVLSVESTQAGMMTEIRYGVSLKSNVKVSDFMEKMQVACGNNRVILTAMRGNDLGV
jgi:hypothetical protein